MRHAKLNEGQARRTVKKAMRGEAPTTARGKRAVKAALAKSPSKQKRVDLDVAAKVYDHQLRQAKVEDLHEVLPALAAGLRAGIGGALKAGKAVVGGAVGLVKSALTKKAKEKVIRRGIERGKQQLSLEDNMPRALMHATVKSIQHIKQPTQVDTDEGNFMATDATGTSPKVRQSPMN